MKKSRDERCRWKRCNHPARKLLLGVPLCNEHQGEGLALEASRSWPAFHRALANKVSGESARDLNLRAAELADAATPSADAGGAA